MDQQRKPKSEGSYNEDQQSVDGNDPRMTLSNDERRFATKLKREVQKKNPDLEPLSDFMYAQYAIISRIYQTELVEVIHQIEQLQHFRQEYGIEESFQHARHITSRLLLEISPEHHIAFGFGMHGYFHVLDLTKFDAASVLASHEKTSIWMAAEYYMKHAAYPDLEGVRYGLMSFVECEGYDWRDNQMFNLKAMEKLSYELGASYPMHFRLVKHFNANSSVNLALSRMRSILPVHIHEYFDVHGRCAAGRLENVFGQPNPPAGGQKIATDFESSLRRRYENEALFSLDT